MLEIVVLDKYLIRGKAKGYAFSKVKNGKPARVIMVPRVRKVSGIETVVNVPDYSNFGDECYPDTLADCFSKIIDEEVRNSNIKGDGLRVIIEISDLIKESKESIDTIAKVLSYQEKK